MHLPASAGPKAGTAKGCNATEHEPRLSIVIVGYNSDGVLKECLRRLGAVNSDVEVILVDNNSNDSTIATFSNSCPRGRVVVRSENGGFAVAVNEGVRVAKGRNVALLNPDAYVSAAQILTLCDKVTGNVGVVGPVVRRSASDRTITAGRYPSAWRMFLHSTGLSSLGRFARVFEGHYFLQRDLSGSPRPADWVTGGCLVTSSEIFREQGGLSERWFMYGEDIDYCTRVRKAGYEIVLDPAVLVDHDIGGSSAGVDGKASTIWLQNLYDVYLKNTRPSLPFGPLVWRVSVAAGYAMRGTILAARGFLAADERTKLSMTSKSKNFFRYSRCLPVTRFKIAD